MQYIALRPVLVIASGQAVNLRPGNTVELTEDEAREFMRAGHLRPVEIGAEIEEATAPPQGKRRRGARP